jgi:hypothetical protein
MQDWRRRSMFKEPLIYFAVLMGIAFAIFFGLALWWPI